MMLNLQSKNNMCESTYCFVHLFIIFLLITLLFGCENDKTKALTDKPKTLSLTNNLTKTEEGHLVTEINKEIVFAPTVAHGRKGLWFGGAPAINKRVSGINTYYRIKSENTPNQLKVTLRFEGAQSVDAKVEFRTLDGAKFLFENQKNKWSLKPNIASEITFTVVVPENISYLTLDTFQNNKGSSRAFILEKTLRTKR